MSLAEIYDDYLVATSPDKERDPLRLFVTDVGKCPRAVALRLTQAERKPVTPTSRAMWDVAEYIEETLMKALDAKNLLYDYQAPIAIDDHENWGGRLDIARWDWDKLRIVEVKTINPNAFKWGDRPKLQHVMQATIYDHYYDYDRESLDPLLWYFSRGDDKNEPEEYTITPDFAPCEVLMDSLDKMRDNLPELPPVLPRLLKEFDGGKTIKQGPDWRCKPIYCDYLGVSCFPDISWNKWVGLEKGCHITDKADMGVLSRWAQEQAHEALLAAL